MEKRRLFWIIGGALCILPAVQECLILIFPFDLGRLQAALQTLSATGIALVATGFTLDYRERRQISAMFSAILGYIMAVMELFRASLRFAYPIVLEMPENIWLLHTSFAIVPYLAILVIAILTMKAFSEVKWVRLLCWVFIILWIFNQLESIFINLVPSETAKVVIVYATSILNIVKHTVLGAAFILVGVGRKW